MRNKTKEKCFNPSLQPTNPPVYLSVLLYPW